MDLSGGDVGRRLVEVEAPPGPVPFQHAMDEAVAGDARFLGWLAFPEDRGDARAAYAVAGDDAFLVAHVLRGVPFVRLRTLTDRGYLVETLAPSLSAVPEPLEGAPMPEGSQEFQVYSAFEYDLVAAAPGRHLVCVDLDDGLDVVLTAHRSRVREREPVLGSAVTHSSVDLQIDLWEAASAHRRRVLEYLARTQVVARARARGRALAAGGVVVWMMAAYLMKAVPEVPPWVAVPIGALVGGGVWLVGSRRVVRSARLSAQPQRRPGFRWHPQGVVRAGVSSSGRSRRRTRLVMVSVVLALVVMDAVIVNAKHAPAATRLRYAVSHALGHGPYAFLQTSHGQPVTYSSCRPVRVYVDTRHQPPGTERVVEEAVASAAQATGLDIAMGRSDGRSEDPRSAPVLVSWTSAAETPGLRADVVGLGTSKVGTTSGGLRYYVGGYVDLDAPQLARDDRVRIRAVVLHELGHVLGLAHVRSPYEVMYRSGGPLHYGSGDLAGLKRLGRGPCV